MRASVLQSLLSSFDSIAVDEGVRQQFKDVVRQVGQAYGYSMSDRNERVRSPVNCWTGTYPGQRSVTE